MMMRFSGWLVKVSTGWLTINVLVIFILFMIFVLPGQAQKADEYADGAGSPDTTFFYTPEKLYEFAEIYGEEGRQAYIQARFTFDLIFPLVYGTFLVVTISWLVKRISLGSTRWYLLNLMPIAGVIFDLLENGMASVVMHAYPERQAGAAFLASIFTPLKWVFVYGSFAALMAALVIWIVQRFKPKGDKT